MAKDFYSNGFDRGTLTKVEIFDKYFNEAFPVFVHSKGMNEIYICDFFAGQGMDKNGKFGTSLNILDSIVPYCQAIIENKKKVVLILNDKEEHEALKRNVQDFLFSCKQNCNIGCKCIFVLDENLIIRNNDFKTYFYKVIKSLDLKSKSPKIIFIDPFGLVFGNDVVKHLIALSKTDFICFIPSSFLKRFKSFKRFNEYLDLKELNFQEHLPEQCHKVIAEYFETLIPNDKEYYLCHFSIKKGSNYYGLIFGTNHSLGAEKFLRICWTIDQVSGEADYNINREACYNGNTLFEEMNIPVKISNLKKNLEERILNRTIKTNKDAYLFGLKSKCLPKQVTEILKDMIKNKHISNLKTKNQDIHKLQVEEIKIIRNHGTN